MSERDIEPPFISVTEYAQVFDAPSEDGPMPWNERMMGRPCPARSTVNGYPVHRVKRTVTYGPWIDDDMAEWSDDYRAIQAAEKTYDP